MKMTKKIVGYAASPDDWIKVGGRACILPINHPIQIDCIEPVATSMVIRYDVETGEFETENTIYRRIN